MNLLLENDPTYRKVKKGSLVFKEGDVINEILLIKTGKVLLFSLNETKIIPLGVLTEKDSLGEEFFNNDVHTIYAYALENCEFVVVPIEKVRKYLKEQAEWVKAILEKISLKLTATRDVLIEHKLVDDDLMLDFDFNDEFEVHLKKIIKGE